MSLAIQIFKGQDMTSDTPKFLVRLTFESNTAFFIAIFILICGVAWGLRDHRRRQLELATEEHEDRLYFIVLTGMFLMCVIGAYNIFRKQKLMREYEGKGHLVPIDQLVTKKVDQIMSNVNARKSLGTIYQDENDEDFTMFSLGLGLVSAALVISWLATRSGWLNKNMQFPPRQGLMQHGQPQSGQFQPQSGSSPQQQ